MSEKLRAAVLATDSDTMRPILDQATTGVVRAGWEVVDYDGNNPDDPFGRLAGAVAVIASIRRAEIAGLRLMVPALPAGSILGATVASKVPPRLFLVSDVPRDALKEDPASPLLRQDSADDTFPRIWENLPERVAAWLTRLAAELEGLDKQ
ncbi:MAG TPA: hypothetical protein VLF69_01185 [Candidatus Saccharimonadales bacterium]|nr:hypothetical protein [Candidatus Saccharimonadales bacterium]